MKLLQKLKYKPDPIWDYLRKKIDTGLDLRRPYEAQWVLNLAFLAGRQYSFFNATSHTLHEITKQPDQVFVVDNIILPKWKRQVGDLTKAQPQMLTVPNSAQEEDIAAAKLGTKVAKNYYKTKLKKKKIRALSGWIYATGNAFLSDYWDRKAGPMKLSKENGKISYAGDVGCSVWSPFELIFPIYSGSTIIDEMDWVIIRQRKSLDWLRDNFEGGEAIEEEEINPTSLTVENLFLSSMGRATISKIPSAYLITAYVKPCKDFPKGAFIRACNGVIEKKVDWPYNEFPIEHFKDIEFPNVFYGDATVTHAIPLQIDWNKLKSSISEFNQEVAKVKIAEPRGSKIEVRMDGSHREIVRYKPVMGHKPEFLQPYSLPPSVEHELAQIMISLENLFSQHEVTRGTNKSDIRSGDMVELLLEQDANGGVTSFTIFEEAMEGHIGRILARVQAGYTTERIIKIGESEDDFEIVSFKGADLRNHRDISVVPGSSLPDSKAARSMQVERRFERGLLGNPADPKTQRRVLRMVDASIVDDVFSEYRQDEILAQWENRVMMRGQDLPINGYDNHAVHKDEHDRFRKSVRFQKLKLTQPYVYDELDMRLEVHNNQHQEILNEQMKQQLQIMQAQGGGK